MLTVLSCSTQSVNKRVPLVKNLDQTDSPFYRFGKPINEFELMVPRSYNHHTQIDSFNKMYYQSVTIGADMGGNFFKSASNKLIPGNTYLIKFYPIRKRVTTQECIDFMLNQGAILTNAQGLTLAWSNNGNKFPSDGWILSLDYRDSLSRQPNVGYKELRVPMIGNDDVKEFGTYSENSAWDTGFAYLLGYFEKRDFTR